MEIKFSFPPLLLLAPQLSLFFWLSDLTTSHCNSIALPFANSIFYTHPPLPEIWLTPELREPFETYSFLVPHSLTLPEYLAQFECKLDYYSLLFTMRSSSVASLFLVSFNDKAIMCRDLRRNVFFHREMENRVLFS